MSRYALNPKSTHQTVILFRAITTYTNDHSASPSKFQEYEASWPKTQKKTLPTKPNTLCLSLCVSLSLSSQSASLARALSYLVTPRYDELRFNGPLLVHALLLLLSSSTTTSLLRFTPLDDVRGGYWRTVRLLLQAGLLLNFTSISLSLSSQQHHKTHLHRLQNCEIQIAGSTTTQILQRLLVYVSMGFGGDRSCLEDDEREREKRECVCRGLEDFMYWLHRFIM